MWIYLPLWLPLLIVALGIAALVKAWLMDGTSSFNDGTFQRQMQLTVGGLVAVVGGLVWGGAMMVMS